MKKLSPWLIIIGSLVLLIPVVGKLYLHNEQQKLYEEYHASLNGDIMDEDFHDKGIGYLGKISPQAIASDENQGENEKGVIGTIRIPSIKADLPLLEGSTGRQLRYGAGHVTSTALPGQQGNCAIAGHRDYTFGTYFSRLDEVKKGDTVQIDYGGKTYTYRVYDSFVVLPTEVSVLNPEKDQSILTLITCTPKGSSSHRLIVRAKLM